MPRRPEGPADAALDRQLVGRLPRILKEHVGRKRAPLGQRALSELRVVAEQPEGDVGDRETRSSRTIVEEFEPAVLVVRAARNRRDVDLIEVVFAGVLDDSARLERVAPFHERRAIRHCVNRPARERGVRSAADLVEAVDRDRRDLVFDLLVGRKDVRVVDAGAAALVQARLGEHVDEHLVERVRIGHLVHEVVPPRAEPVDHLCLVRPIPVGPRERKLAAERIDGLPVVLRVPVRDLIRVVHSTIETNRVLALIPRVLAVLNQVRGALAEAGSRRRKRVEERETVRRQPARRNHVARKRLLGERIDEDARTAEEAIVRVEQLAEVAAPHPLRRDGRGVRGDGEVVDPFLRAEEEQFVFQGTAGHRSAKRIPVLFVVERRRTGVLDRVRAAVARPGVRLERLVPIEE